MLRNLRILKNRETMRIEHIVRILYKRTLIFMLVWGILLRF